MSDSDSANEHSFLDAMQDVVPLSGQNEVVAFKHQSTLAQKLRRESVENEQQISLNFLSTAHVEPVAPLDPIGYKKAGVQDGVFKNLRLGKYRIDSVLNLQKLKFEQSRQAVFNTIQSAQKNGYRTLLIKHGVGLDSKPFPGFTKSYVNKWLQELPNVLAFHSAKTAHGGNGAVYVLVKKSDEQKQANRELHRKR
ncbi:DNA endonuclease SmrA [Aliiglaciecola sp.]|nr:DNA endonuclease SmrA [Aliiglaciecola sp.]